MDLEGELRVGLRVSAGRIEQIRIGSTRPDVAHALLQGRTSDEIRAAVPLLFSICNRSQAAASELAIGAAATGAKPGSQALERCSAAVAAEIVRECAWRTLLDWPLRIDERPGADAVAAARASLSFHPGTNDGTAENFIAVAALGVGAEEWLALRSLSELDRWIDAGATASARFIRRVRDDDVAASAGGDTAAPQVPLLDDLDRAASMQELWNACDADPGFARHPTWRGAPAETGALARLRSDPLIGA
ncbi:MAG TPA: hypothetical protein VNS61_19255, partial [Caldimonas sp.]|nr:hypothetical protein [Caldimonas sp.]